MKKTYVEIIGIVIISIAASLATVAAEESRWWPVQAMPGAIVRLEDAKFNPSLRLSYEMTAQSVAGLAAKSVNEQVNDEMVWVSIGNIDQEDWFGRLMKNNPQVKVRQISGLWELIDKYAEKGIIKGYILYKPDDSRGEIHQERRGINNSVNIATSLAGLFDGIIVDENLEAEAKAHGLKMLMDARDKTQEWCFKNYKDRFNHRIVCMQDPQNPNTRDLAIGTKAFTMYGSDEPLPTVMQWLEPGSPVLGWNGGDEFTMTRMSSIWGHIQTATNWCGNLPVLMAGTEKYKQARVKSFDPRMIDFNDTRSAVSFVDTDGDNVQWFEGNFFRPSDSNNSNSYWGNPQRGKIPFGWSCCFTNLSQLFPEAIDYAADTQLPNDWFIEWGGGYYYPDLFGRNRPNRWELLSQHARRTWELMKKNNTRIIGFNVSKLDSTYA